MGTSLSYHCTHCGHEVLAGEGRGVGFMAIVYAMRCRRCGYAGDINVRGAAPSVEADTEAELAALEPCPKCRARDYEPWEEPYPCPKCKKPMGPGGAVVMWD